MYKLLESKMTFVGMTKKQLAQEMGLGYNTLLAKFKHESSFSLDEAAEIKRIVDAPESIEVLFELLPGRKAG
ncbi:hypothetical protein CAFE_20750 [Caprobacter fermentans]|uniref:HTH cro/C1-type domain-containing protein n=1 Tax=Caproicibacter fermentans TaxID=2576756 RepID=A0A6N8HZS9_9FIRM|nr:hypothetical protein [Caproicibacter fermentans]MVB11361.1 hypothetical protein [Caproicibacter fermentans]